VNPIPAGFQQADPAAVGLSANTVDELAAQLRSLVDEGRRAGIVSGILRHGKLVHFQSYGSRNLEQALPMEGDTIFRLYSMTRAVTAVGLLTLCDEGRLKLDDPVADYLPEFADTPVIKEVRDGEVVTEPQHSPMTIYHLMTYTAGLAYPESYPKSLGITLDQVLRIGATTEAAIQYLARQPLLSQPGAHWYYGFSGDVLGRIAEVVSGQSYDRFLDERVFQPLRMTDTGFVVPTDHWDRLAEVYAPDDDGELINATDRVPQANSYREGEALHSGGGGLVGTAGDYLRFCQMLLNGGELDGVRVIEADTAALMTRNHLREDQGPLMWYAKGRGTPQDPWTSSNGYGWGLGIGVRLEGESHVMPGSDGEYRWDGLANTIYFIDPVHDIVVVAMSQYLSMDQRELEQTIRKTIYGGMVRS
jgi:CubicO group peptidase (beta-lactamase class C family)